MYFVCNKTIDRTDFSVVVDVQRILMRAMVS